MTVCLCLVRTLHISDYDACERLRDLAHGEYSLAEFNKNENEIFMASENDIGAAQSLATAQITHETDTGTVGRESGDDFSAYLTHPVLISSYAWSPATPTSIASVTDDLVSLYLTNASPMMKGKLSGFMRFRAMIRLTFVVQGSPAMAGTLVYTSYPTAKSAPLGSSLTVNRATIVNSRVAPHVVIDPSQSRTYTLDLPVVSPTGCYRDWETDRKSVV